MEGHFKGIENSVPRLKRALRVHQCLISSSFSFRARRRPRYRGFDGKITYLLEHTEGSKEEKPAIFSGTDILAEDWEVIEDKEEV